MVPSLAVGWLQGCAITPDVRPRGEPGGTSGRVPIALVGASGTGGGPVPLHSTRPQTLVGPGATDVAPERRVEVFELAGILGVQAARLTILALNGLVHLLAVYGDLDGGRDPQSNLVAPDIHHGDDDVIADDDAFVAVSGQDQHLQAPSSCQRDP